MNEEIRQINTENRDHTDQQEIRRKAKDAAKKAILDWYKENICKKETCTIIYTKENPERIHFKNRSIEEAIFRTFTGDSYH